MAAEISAPPSSATGTPPIRRWAFGPGLVFVLAAMGPQDIVSNAAAGANYGYNLLWALILIVLARYAILEATARYVVVTGETLMTGYARAGKWAGWLILVSILVKRHLASLYQLLLLGAAMQLLFPLPTRWGLGCWALASWVAGFAVMYWGRYRVVERASKPLLVLLGGALVLAAVFARPDWKLVAAGALVPSLPEGQGLYSTTVLLMALVGSGVGALSNLKYASFVYEKGWGDRSFLGRQRVDLALSGLGLFAMLFLIQVAAAATLQNSQASLREIDDLLPIFTRALGSAGPAVLAVGMWAAVFTTYVGANTGYALMVSDIWHNVLGKSGGSGAQSNLGASPVYRASIAWFCASPLYVLFTGWKPVWLVLIDAMLMAVLLPVIVSVLLWLTNSRKLMGKHVSGVAANAVMLLVVVVAAWLTYRNGLDLWARFRPAH